MELSRAFHGQNELNCAGRIISDGGMPKRALKTRKKYSGSEKPSLAATSVLAAHQSKVNGKSG
jgi:hypothetical protein